MSRLTGLSGGIYQTIGSVRNSGCRGSANFQALINWYTGDRTVTFEGELRWDFARRWSLVGFGGAGGCAGTPYACSPLACESTTCDGVGGCDVIVDAGNSRFSDSKRHAAELAEKGLDLSPPADARTLVRRATYDLIDWTGQKRLGKKVAALEEDPWECEHLSDLQDGLFAARDQALAQPVPPVLYDFHGFLAVVEDMQGFDLARKQAPESIDASFLLAIDNAQGLLAMGQAMLPQLAEMNIEPDGKAHRFELPETGAEAETAWVALSESAIALSVSEDAESGLAAHRADSAHHRVE